MNPLSTFIRHQGLSPLLQSTEDRFARLLLETDTPHPALTNYLTHLAANDMSLLEHILSNHELVSEQTAWAILLLREAYASAAPGAAQSFLRRLAHKAGLANFLPQSMTLDLGTLTPSQRQAFEKMRAMAEVFFQQAGAPVSRVKLRLNSLIVGSSGTGKSHLAHLLGDALGGIRVLTLNVGSWIVQGARQDPTTIEVIRQAVEQEERLIIFIDELDKFSATDSGWSLSQLTEIFSLLDRRIGSVGGGKNVWTEAQQKRLRENVYICAAGAWQEVWTTSLGKRAGFQNPSPSGSEVAEKIRRAGLIPDELLLRFSSDWLILEPYRSADFAAIAANLNLPVEVLDPALAEASGKNFRYVEDCITACKVDQHLLAMRERRSPRGPDRGATP